MARKKAQRRPKPRLPLPRKPPKVERDGRKEERRQRGRRRVLPEVEDA